MVVVQEKGNRCHCLFITFRIRKYRFFFGSPNYKINHLRPTNSKIGNWIQAEHSCIAKSININILHQVRWSHIHRRQQITSKQRVSPSRPPPRPILSPRNLRTHASSLLNGRHGRFYHGFGKKGMLSLFGGGPLARGLFIPFPVSFNYFQRCSSLCFAVGMGYAIARSLISDRNPFGVLVLVVEFVVYLSGIENAENMCHTGRQPQGGGSAAAY